METQINGDNLPGSHLIFRGRQMVLGGIELDVGPSKQGQADVFLSAVLQAKIPGLCPGERELQIVLERNDEVVQILNPTIFDVDQTASGETVIQVLGKVMLTSTISKSPTAETTYQADNPLGKAQKKASVQIGPLIGKSQDNTGLARPKRSLNSIMSEMVEDILNRVKRLPPYASRLLNLLGSDAACADKVIDLIKMDPSLVAMVMKSVNSSYYNLRSKVNDLHHAVLLLGFNQIYQLVIREAVRSRMPNRAEFQKIQSHSVILSIVAYELALSCNLMPVTLCTVGLLHDIGKSLLLLLKERNPRFGSFFEMLDDCKIGSHLLRKWNLPRIVCGTIEYQRHPEFSPPEAIPGEFRKSVAVIYAAHLAYDYMSGMRENELPKAFFSGYMDLIDAPETSVDKLVKGRVFRSIVRKIDTLPEEAKKFFELSIERLT